MNNLSYSTRITVNTDWRFPVFRKFLRGHLKKSLMWLEYAWLNLYDTSGWPVNSYD
jgi:hypothetical protein